MRDIMCFCHDPECPCEGECCQNCDKKDTCENRCSFMDYKEKIYSDDNYLLEQLEGAVNKFDAWILAVGIEKIQELIKEKDELLIVAKEMYSILFATGMSVKIPKSMNITIKEYRQKMEKWNQMVKRIEGESDD